MTTTFVHMAKMHFSFAFIMFTITILDVFAILHKLGSDSWILHLAMKWVRNSALKKLKRGVGFICALPIYHVRVLSAYGYLCFKPLKQNNINLQAGVSCCGSLESCKANKI